MHAAALLIVALLATRSAAAEDAIDRLQRGNILPPDMLHAHAHSDATEPIGRLLDMLAAGAFAEARAILPEACDRWRTTRQASPLTGRFVVWTTEVDLNALCQ